jgi:hypothetical protein
LPSHGKRLSAQIGMAYLLHSAEESIQIKVQDRLKQAQSVPPRGPNSVIFGMEKLSGIRYTTHGA